MSVVKKILYLVFSVIGVIFLSLLILFLSQRSDIEVSNITGCQSDSQLMVYCEFSKPEDIVVLPDERHLLISEFGAIVKPLTVQGSVYSKFAHTVEGCHYDVEDLAVGFIKLAGDATLVAEASWATNVPQDHSYVKLIGTKGGAEIHGDKLTVFTEMHGELVDITPVVRPRSWCDCIAAEIAHLVTCIQEEREPMSTGEQGVEMMKILEGIYKSAEQGKTIRLR